MTGAYTAWIVCPVAFGPWPNWAQLGRVLGPAGAALVSSDAGGLAASGVTRRRRTVAAGIIRRRRNVASGVTGSRRAGGSGIARCPPTGGSRLHRSALPSERPRLDAAGVLENGKHFHSVSSSAPPTRQQPRPDATPASLLGEERGESRRGAWARRWPAAAGKEGRPARSGEGRSARWGLGIVVRAGCEAHGLVLKGGETRIRRD